MSEKKKRIQYFGIAKGILIILLLIHHYNSAAKRLEIDHTTYNVFVWQSVFTAFFMQCFFIISGYCSSFKKDYSSFFLGIFRQLFIPYIFFQIIDNVIWKVAKNDISFNSFISPITNVPNTTLWFLNALILCKITLYFLRKVANDSWLIAISVIMLIAGVIIHQYEITPNYFCYHNSMCSIFFVAIGNLLKEKQILYKHLLKYCIYVYPILFILLLAVHKSPPTLTAYIGVSIKSLPLFLLTSLTGSFAFLAICKKIGKNAFFEYWGKNSIIVYALHFTPLYFTISIIHKAINPESFLQYLAYIGITYLIEILICYSLICLFKLKYLSKIVGR